jgi:hypothetical protein
MEVRIMAEDQSITGSEVSEPQAPPAKEQEDYSVEIDFTIQKIKALGDLLMVAGQTKNSGVEFMDGTLLNLGHILIEHAEQLEEMTRDN